MAKQVEVAWSFFRIYNNTQTETEGDHQVPKLEGIEDLIRVAYEERALLVFSGLVRLARDRSYKFSEPLLNGLFKRMIVLHDWKFMQVLKEEGYVVDVFKIPACPLSEMLATILLSTSYSMEEVFNIIH